MLKDSFETQFDVQFPKNQIIIEKKKKMNYVVVVLLGFLMVAFGYMGIFFIGIDVSSLIFFVGLEFILALIIWVNIKQHLYPVLEIDLLSNTAFKRPLFNFLKTKETILGQIMGIDFLVKPISGHASPFEEGNTDYRKRIVVKTEKGEFTLFSFINRSEELEESALAMIEEIKDRFSSKTA